MWIQLKSLLFFIICLLQDHAHLHLSLDSVSSPRGTQSGLHTPQSLLPAHSSRYYSLCGKCACRISCDKKGEIGVYIYTLLHFWGAVSPRLAQGKAAFGSKVTKRRKKKKLLSRHWRCLKQLTASHQMSRDYFLNESYFPIYPCALENDMKHEMCNITLVYPRYEGVMLSESSQNRSGFNMLSVPARYASCGIDPICVHLDARCSRNTGPRLAGPPIVWWQK